MKKLILVLFVLSLFSTISAQVEYEKVGSLYNFWNQTDGYEIVGDYTYITHDGIIEVYHIKADDTLELVAKINDQKYGRETKLVGNYLFATYRSPEIHYVAFDMTDPTNPQKVKDIVATDSDLNIIESVVNGNFAYSDNLKVWNTTDILNPTLISSTLEALVNPNGATRAKPLEMDGEYLLYELYFYNDFNMSSGWSYYHIDVSDSSNPVNLGKISKPNPKVAINDTLTFTLALHDFILIFIKDADGKEVARIEGSWGDYPGTEGYLARFGDYLYATVPSNIDTNSTDKRPGDVYIIDISDPFNPFVEKMVHLNANFGGGKTIGNKVYRMSNKAQFSIVDFSDPLNPVEVITELSDAFDGGPLAKIIIKGNYAFVQGNAAYCWTSSPYIFCHDYPVIRIIDISDPTNMVEVAVIDSASLWQIEGDYLYSGKPGKDNYGFFIYNISDPTNPTFESFFKRDDAVGRLKVHNGYAYLTIAPYQTKFYVVDVRDASNPKLKSIFGVVYDDFCFDGNILYVRSSLQKWDITDPVNPVDLGMASSSIGKFDQIEYRDNKVFTSGSSSRDITIHDISNFPNVTKLGSYVSNTGPNDFALHDIYAFIAWKDGLKVIDFNDLNNLTLATTINVPGFTCYNVALADNYIYTANKHSFDVYKLQLPSPPEAFALISPETEIDTTTADLLWHSTTDPNVSTVNFDVYLATTSDFSDIYKVAEGITDTTLSVSNLQIGQTYYWKVHATDDNTTGTWSTNNLSFTVFSPIVTTKFVKDIDGDTKGGVTVLDENIIYVPSSSKVVRFDGNGGIEYTLTVNGVIKSSSTITSDHTVYIASTDNNLYSFNSNGVTNPNWPVALGAEATASVAVGPNNNLYIGTSNGIFQAISRNGEILWSYNVGAAVYSSSVISSNGTLYVINKNGRLFAFDLNTLDPTNVQYKWKLELGEAVSSSPALDASNNIYITTELGKLLKVKDSGSAGAIEWTYNSEGSCESSPIIDVALNIYFSGKNGKIFSVSGTTGNLNWEAETHYSHSNPDEILKASPTLSADGSKLYVGDTFGTIYGISTSTGKIVWANKSTGLIEGPILAANNKIYFCMEGVVVALNEPGLGFSNKQKNVAMDGSPLWPTFQGNAQRTGYNGESFVPEYSNILALRENDDDGIPKLLDSIKTISGIITASNQFGTNGPAFIQDSEAGVALYDGDLVSKFVLGDSISVTGKVGFYNGLTQLRWDVNTSAVTVHKNIADPKPKVVTIQNVLNQSWNWIERVEGNLVKIIDVEFEVTGTFSGNANYSFTDGTNSLNVRIDNDVNLVNENIPTEKVDLVGCVGQFKVGTPYNTGYQLILRYKEDIKTKTDVNEIVEIPTVYSLSQNYPNPFNPATTITYALPKSGEVSLKVYDILGSEVSSLVNKYQVAGFYSISFDASNLRSGIYFYTIRTGRFSESKKMILLK